RLTSVVVLRHKTLLNMTANTINTVYLYSIMAACEMQRNLIYSFVFFATRLMLPLGYSAPWLGELLIYLPQIPFFLPSPRHLHTMQSTLCPRASLSILRQAQLRLLLQ